MEMRLVVKMGRRYFRGTVFVEGRTFGLEVASNEWEDERTSDMLHGFKKQFFKDHIARTHLQWHVTLYENSR